MAVITFANMKVPAYRQPKRDYFCYWKQQHCKVLFEKREVLWSSWFSENHKTHSPVSLSSFLLVFFFFFKNPSQIPKALLSDRDLITFWKKKGKSPCVLSSPSKVPIHQSCPLWKKIAEPLLANGCRFVSIAFQNLFSIYYLSKQKMFILSSSSNNLFSSSKSSEWLSV